MAFRMDTGRWRSTKDAGRVNSGPLLGQGRRAENFYHVVFWPASQIKKPAVDGRRPCTTSWHELDLIVSLALPVGGNPGSGCG
jgi:hypothetical protein